ncbi:MAG TPA: peroxiredoxin [Acidimicrobiia bacterium]|nr:peroxiredoxin [Acidimicrobiia bacterium]
MGNPVPVDDGAADHLLGLEFPDIAFESTSGEVLHPAAARGRLVLYVYPRTGGPAIDLPDDWDLIPGARGCTPQACAFRDHQGDQTELGVSVWGLSAQPVDEQREFAARMHIPFPLLNDANLALSRPPLSLPTFTSAGMTLYKRITLIVNNGTVEHVFYPVHPPERNASDVIAWLGEQA